MRAPAPAPADPLALRWADGGVELVAPGSALALLGAGGAGALGRLATELATELAGGQATATEPARWARRSRPRRSGAGTSSRAGTPSQAGFVWLLADGEKPLHPGESVGAQIAAAVGGTRRAAWDRAVDLLELTGVPEPQHRVAARPHRLGALDRQRAQLALILANRPRLLLARESTAGLSATEAATFATTLRRLWQRLGFTLLLADSPLEVCERVAEEILVLNGGVPVERRRRAPQSGASAPAPSSSSSSST